MIIRESYGDQVGYEALAPIAATGITAALITPTTGAYFGQRAKVAVIKALTHPVNFRMDGTDPTAAAGMQLAAGDYWVIEGTQNIKNFKCINTAAGAASIRVLLFF